MKKLTAMALTLISISVAAVHPVWAGEATQQVAAKILQIGIGPRGVGMGEAQVAAADNVYSLFWNPAGLAQMGQNEISFMHNAWFGGISSEYLTYGQLLTQGTFALSFNYLSFGEFEKYGVDSSNLPVPLEGKFSAFSLVTSIGYGFRVAPEIGVGAAVKLLSQSVDTYNTLTGAIDLGAQYHKVWQDLDLGLLVQNLGFPIQGFSLPLTVKAGASYALPFLIQAKSDRFTAVLDLVMPVPLDQPFYTNVGMEYVYDHTLALRAGYKISEINSLGGGAGMTAGLGLQVSDYSLDYALASFGDLGLTHRIAISAGLGEPEKARPARRLEMPKAAPSTEAEPSAAEVLVPKLTGLEMRMPVTVNVRYELNPNVKTRVERATFDFQINTDRKIQKWDFRIRAAKGDILKELSSRNVPTSLTWDGRDQLGQVPADSAQATYEFAYSLEDGTADKVTGRVAEAKAQAAVPETGAEVDKNKLPAILFEEGSFELSGKAAEALNDALALLQSRPYAQIMVEGYTDGASELSQEFVLSQRRVDAVVRVLATSANISAGKLSVHARGSKNPVAPNSTEANRAKNRRVEITIIPPR